MNIQEKLSRARASLVLRHPFFGALALRLRLIEAPEGSGIDSAGTDGASIYYCPEFIDKLPHEQIVGVLAHEVMHCAFLHITRKGSRDHARWNCAGDYVINSILEEAGLQLPPDRLLNKAWDGKCAEEIYNLLPTQPQGKGSSLDPGGCGGILDPKGSGGQPQTQSEREEQEAEWKIAVAQAAHQAKLAGRLPGSLERLIDATLQSQTNWREELHQFCKTPIPADVTWNRPNRRYIASGLYMPSRDIVVTGTFVVVIDTSGSIGEKELNEFGSEILAIVDQLKPEEVIVMYCDAAVAHVDRFKKHDEITFGAHGGGGTDFRPPFQWLENEEIRPDALVYLTDGYGPFPDEDSVNFPCLWAINNRQVEPPFGQHVVIEV